MPEQLLNLTNFQDRFGPFEVVQPAEENIVDTGPLTPFQAIPDVSINNPQDLPKVFIIIK
jgi:hypothetical protein